MSRSVSGTTLVALLAARVQATPDAAAYWTHDMCDRWQRISWSQFGESVVCAARLFSSLGLQRGDRIGIVASPCLAWEVAQHAALCLGAVVVGLDPSLPQGDLERAVQRVPLDGVVVSHAGYHRALAVALGVRLRFALCAPDSDAARNLGEWELLAATGAGLRMGRLNAPDLDDLCGDDPVTVLFTSGTTGEPKPLLYRHRQLCTAVDAILGALPRISSESRLLCWMPLSNLFQRMVNYCAIARGATTYFVDDPCQIMEALKEVSPHVFVGVPRFYEKLHEGIEKQIAKQGLLTRLAVKLALSVGRAHALALRSEAGPNLRLRLLHGLLDRLVLRGLRAAFGRGEPYLLSGSAPMQRWLLEALSAMGVVVHEAYGVSENATPIALTRPGRIRWGTVGELLEGNLCKQGSDGELLLDGPTRAEPYEGSGAGHSHVTRSLRVRGRASGTAGPRVTLGREARIPFHATGDVVEIDAEGFLRVLGRKGDVLKLSTGRKIAPDPIENALRGVPYVEHALLLGHGQPRPSALVAVDPEQLKEAEVCAERRLSDDRDPLVRRVQRDLNDATAALPMYARPHRYFVTFQKFTVATGELTPNFKLRRGAVAQRYAEQLRALERTAASEPDFGLPSIQWDAPLRPQPTSVAR